MFDARRGAWSTFQYLVRERLREENVTVERDGTLGLGGSESAARRSRHERALVRGADGGQRVGLVRGIRREVLDANGTGALDRRERRPRRPRACADGAPCSARRSRAHARSRRRTARGGCCRPRAADRRRGRGRAGPARARRARRPPSSRGTPRSRGRGCRSPRRWRRSPRSRRSSAARRARTRAEPSARRRCRSCRCGCRRRRRDGRGGCWRRSGGGPSCSRGRGAAPGARRPGSRSCPAARSRRSAACGRETAPPGERWAYPTASAPRSAIAASRACATRVRSTLLAGLRLYPAIPHIRRSSDRSDRPGGSR